MTPPGAEPRRLEFEQKTVILGSDSLCDLCLEGPGIDARHAVIIPRETHVDLFDIGVTGGVLVNGTRVTHAELQPSDEIWIGSTVLHAALSDAAGVAGAQILNIVDAPSNVLSEQQTQGAIDVGSEGEHASSDGTAETDLFTEESEKSEAPAWAGDNRFALLDRPPGRPRSDIS